MRTLISNGIIVNEDRAFRGSIVIDGDFIAQIVDDGHPADVRVDNEIDAAGCYVLPGVIDEHVHFREPGMTEKADMATESRAAAAGGVTTFFDMPNTVPNTTSLEALDRKFEIAAGKSLVNYSFFFGATNDNYSQFDLLDPKKIPGIKLFMGASTGNMLVDRLESLERIFAYGGLPLMTHCEDTALIDSNMQHYKGLYGDDPDVACHSAIRSREACLKSTQLAVGLARRFGTRLHVAHLSTAEELEMFGKDSNITAEAVVGHLAFTEDDCKTLGARIKVNPAIKKASDREALLKALSDGRIATVATDHAPHLPAQKQGGCAKAASGMPSVQFSLPFMLQQVSSGVLDIERVVRLMCHNPAEIFGVRGRGFLREGYHADIVMVAEGSPWTADAGKVLSKCGWTPFDGRQFDWRVVRTICNGITVYDGRQTTDSHAGKAVEFR